MTILLTPEEIDSVLRYQYRSRDTVDKIVAKAQLRKFIVWGNETCPEFHSEGFTRRRWDCKYCLAEMVKETE